MSVRQTSFVSDEYYHLYNRGNSKQLIFHDEQDYRYFMNLLIIMNNEQRSKSGITKPGDNLKDAIVSIGAYCCMPNHFHILIKQEKDNGISLFMQKLSTAYVMFYNKKYKRTGSLFEGKFKSKYASEDRYLKYLFSYIHLNPLKIIDSNWKRHKIDKEKYNFLLNYNYSSFLEYKTGEYTHVNIKSFPNYFPDKKSFIHETYSWLNFGN